MEIIGEKFIFSKNRKAPYLLALIMAFIVFNFLLLCWLVPISLANTGSIILNNLTGTVGATVE
ncbi:MAG TPA: hypothetical protein VEI27_01100, partial [Dehalococcoidales bacterium]|nr:hypothetical protein [Dehalococcoidales bacterium]